MDQLGIKNQHVKILMDQNTGLYSMDFNNAGSFINLCSAILIKGKEIQLSSEFSKHEIRTEQVQDLLGTGLKMSAKHFDTDDFVLEQTIVCYKRGYLTIKLTIISTKEVSTNCMIPIYGQSKDQVLKMETEDIQFLSVPFDNDKWAKFVDYPAAYAAMSYEFTAIHGKDKKDGFVIGSIEHDNWKTGIEIGTLSDHKQVNTLKVIAGIATEDTRDLEGSVHGYLQGKKIESPRIFLGYFASYQDGFQEFGNCNALIKPPIAWNGPVQFGWNSWAALMGRLTFDKYKVASDFMKTIKHSYCDANGTQCINFDAYWQSFVTKMKDSVAYVEENGQLPGTYFCPFITSPPFNHEVSGTDGNYLFEDLLLRDREGKILPPVDGLYSLDPTHPGTLSHMEYETKRIIKWGFKSIKTDFLGHGCREGAFYNKAITTGVQAYNYGMQYFNECVSEEKAGYPIFLSLSIDPIFPHGYGHARRISCDAFGSIDQSAYLNNCITYLWWMNDCLYRFNDPDHIVLYRTHDTHSTTFEEGKTRFHTGVICGSLMITSDDYELEEARNRARVLLTNEEINEIARKGEAFKPIAGNIGQFAADTFMRVDDDAVVVAVFNYNLSDAKTAKVSLTELGFGERATCSYKDMWTKEVKECIDIIEIELKPTQSTIIKVYK